MDREIPIEDLTDEDAGFSPIKLCNIMANI
jgi:hypothetical protein